MEAVQLAAMNKVAKKLSALRMTLNNEERAALDYLLMVQNPADVSAHSLAGAIAEGGVAGKTGGVPEVAARLTYHGDRGRRGLGQARGSRRMLAPVR